ncbi:SusC/RagA family TonB-linked outer membrane protein [Flavivirga sp. 57AJ16]|uniref:SusC/RagA family TonB-linked outer membrane protein n=1 Tax=Flavivirga sp. 57AJ16 TaxID=3025307 RepID=UPI002367124C|nr:SusC/RagA family TonB-linked outer membrane protein [Flavivirga sp. 57AJ16]MDD7884375.1 SusC/RagA family TonB-linked outer membrane protein [Flavivirga sp. 57AJ16]
MCKRLLNFLVFVFLLSSSTIIAQSKTVSGTISDQDGLALPGANVILEGTNTGVSSDFDGKYYIEIPNDGILVYSMLGFKEQKVSTAGQTTINVTMQESTEALDEIVVTALGIKRERKSLGYSVQEIEGSSVAQAREPNMVNALSGKITGLQVVKGSGGPAGSSKIILRGFSSLVGDNQPLIVVDGVPLDNFTGSSNNEFFNTGEDFGNGLGDINPDDIESLSVLKGASAAALYGSRAGNGVILITTKTGKAQKGLGIAYSVTTGFQSIFMTPDLQSSFGQGSLGTYDELSGNSWGPKIEGQTETGPVNGSVVFNAFDNINNFYKNGFSQNHSLSFQDQVSEATSLYSSANYLKDDSNIPGATLERINLITRGVSKFGETKNWTLDTKVQYNKTTANNRPRNGLNAFNSYRTIVNFPRSLDIRQFSAGSDEFGNQLWYDTNTNQINPYWLVHNNLKEDSRDRFIFSGSLKHEFNDWLSAEIKGGADLYTTNTETKLFSGSPDSATGRYTLGKSTFTEQNYSALIVAAKDNVFGKFGGAFTLGGNLMSTESSGISSNSGQLEVPNVFSLNNGIDRATVEQSFSNKKINSLYGLFQLNYDGYLFLDLTGRNDWTSSLSKQNRSFFYPSISTSFVISDMITKEGGELPSWLTFAKIRASYAEVGNDLDPFQLINVFSVGKDPFDNTTATTGNTLFDPNVVNELIKSTEFGFEARFLNNRIGVDFTYYKSNATNQLIPIPLDPLSGFNQKIINAGDIENKGFELTLKSRILDNDNGLTWDMDINYSRNENTVNELTDGVTQFGLGGFDNLAVLAATGEDYGVIWGTKFRRVEDETDPNFGRILVDGDGLPLATEDKFILGSQQPDALLGLTNSFKYKNFSLGLLISASIGGEVFSGTNQALQASGLAAATVVNGERADIVFDGVFEDTPGNFVENTTGASPQDYWTAITARSGNLGITEANIYDATNVRLRNVSLSYDFTSKFLDRTPFEGLKIGVSANNVWMITSHLNGVDPESVFATGSNATGFEYLSSPTTRTVFFNVAAKF